MPGSLFRGRGHTTLLSALSAELTSRGHEVTILVPSDDYLKVGAKFASSNATKILEFETVPSPESDHVRAIRAGNITKIGFSDMITIFTEVRIEQTSYCSQLLSNDRVIQKLRASQFDLMVADMGNGCDALLPEFLQLPFIALTSNTQFLTMGYSTYGFPLELSYVIAPVAVVQPKGEPISLYTRLRNIFVRVVVPYFTLPRYSRHFAVLQEEFNIRPDADFISLYSKAQFWLANDDYVLEDPHPGMPNWRHIGGMAAARPKALPKEFAEFADGSGEAGFIVFSTGSIVAGFDDNFNVELAAVLKRLPQRIFWKNKDLPSNAGNNTKVSSWLPQNDLLAHPKARLFIGHGGLNGVFEALYHGVPMILIPQMMQDQTLNAKRVENNGYGVLLEKTDFTAEVLGSRIKQILSDGNYSANVRRCSKILQDDDPMDRAVYWVEHVIKFGGGYLRAEVFNLSFVQYHQLDVLALFLVVTVLCAMAVYFSCRLCWSCGRRCLAKFNSDKNCKVD